MNDITRYQALRQELIEQLEFREETALRVSQFADGGSVDVTDSVKQHLLVEIKEYDLMIAHEKLRLNGR